MQQISGQDYKLTRLLRISPSPSIVGERNVSRTRLQVTINKVLYGEMYLNKIRTSISNLALLDTPQPVHLWDSRDEAFGCARHHDTDEPLHQPDVDIAFTWVRGTTVISSS